MKEDVLFFIGCVLACGAAGWLWACFEMFMRTDVHV